MKSVYLALRETSKKWTMPIKNWRLILNQFLTIFAKDTITHMYGEIKSSWHIVDDKINYNFTIPPYTSATLLLEAKNMNKIKTGKKKLKSVKGVKYNGMNQNKYSFELQPGTYSITVKQTKE